MLLDPYVVLSCINASQRSKTLTETLSPKWEETLILNNIRICGSPRAVVASPPTVALEFYDKDTIVSYIMKATKMHYKTTINLHFSICHTKHAR